MNETWKSGDEIRRASRPAHPTPPPVMHSYIKVEQLAVHGQGEVWKVKLSGTSTMLAQKILLPTATGGTDLKRFRREVRTQSGLNHPGIMRIHAAEFDATPPWFIMPLAEGSLRDRLNIRRLSEDETVSLILEVAAALNFAHQQGVVHRDVKPENILRLDGRWVVSDFGLCRDFAAESTTVTRSGSVFGTLPYMAPEQWTDPHNVTALADVFAVGRVLYECLTGETPWPRTRSELVPDRFKYIVNKCTEDDASRRYASMDALTVDLQALSAVDDLALPVDRAQALAARVAAHDPDAARELLQLVLSNLSDDVFLQTFLPSVTPPVLSLLRKEAPSSFHQIIRAFDSVASGGQAFSWTDSAARFLERVFAISPEAEIRDLVLRRILILGTEHNRWAVRDVYVSIIGSLSATDDVLMVARQLSDYPQGADFLRPAVQNMSLPPLIQRALDR